MVSKSRIWCARGEGLSGVEGLLAVVGLEMTTEGVRISTWYRYGEIEGESSRFQGLRR